MELIAQGREPQHRWRRRILPDTTIEVGRRATHGWSVDWDEQISRRHVAITLANNRLRLQALATAKNPVFVDGKQVVDTTILPGQHFVIGQTTFTLSDSAAFASMNQPIPVTEQRFSADYLRNLRYRDADKRIDVLSRLPDLIQSAKTDSELYSSIVNVLIRGVQDAMRSQLSKPVMILSRTTMLKCCTGIVAEGWRQISGRARRLFVSRLKKMKQRFTFGMRPTTRQTTLPSRSVMRWTGVLHASTRFRIRRMGLVHCRSERIP